MSDPLIDPLLDDAGFGEVGIDPYNPIDEEIGRLVRITGLPRKTVEGLIDRGIDYNTIVRLYGEKKQPPRKSWLQKFFGS